MKMIVEKITKDSGENATKHMRKTETLLTWGLSTLLFLLPWQTIWIYQERFVNGAKWEYGTLGLYGTEILLWVCVILFMLWFWKKKKLEIGNWKFELTKDRVFTIFCSLFILYTLISSLWAIDSDLAWQHGLRIMEGFILFFMLWLGPLSFRQAGNAFVAGATLQSLLGIYQFLTQTTVASTFLGLTQHIVSEPGTSIVASESIGRWLRAYGAFPHPNIFGGYLVVSLVVTAHLLLKKTGTCWTGGMKLLIAYYISVMLQVAALFFTFSRSAWLALLGALIVFTFFAVKEKNGKQKISILGPLALLVLLPTILAILFWPIVQTRFMHQSTNEIRSTTERISGYAEALDLFQTNPLVGVGAGNYTRALIEADPSQPGWYYQPTHNVPLLILTELGIVGKLLLSGVLISFFVVLRAQKLLYRPQTLVLLVTYCLLVATDHYLYSSYIGLLIGESFFGIMLKNN